MEITISGIGTSSTSATALPVRPGAPLASGASFALTPVEQGGETGIQLEPYSSGSFTHGTRGNGGVRYVFATYRVRNADTDGNAYTTPRTNLTFVATSAGKTISGTAISKLQRFDGADADATIAPQVIPTGAVTQAPGGELSSTGPDVLQVFDENELAGITAPAGVELFPYAFVVQHAKSTTTRRLAANPALDHFQGMVTFAFKLPLQASAAEDPFTVSAIFLAVDDSETRITQSLEEQTPAGEAAFLARAEALWTTMKTVLPGAGSYRGEASSTHRGEASSTRTICTVRTAGPGPSPTATMVDRAVASIVSAAPADDRPLWVAGPFARDVDLVARDGSGTPLPDVPLQFSFGTPGVLAVRSDGLLRMVPRLDRASTTVSATACGHTSPMVGPLRTSGITPLAAGGRHSLALKTDGTVVAWGDDGLGQIDVPDGLKDVVQVAAGYLHSLALQDEGTVVAWGYNGHGAAAVPPVLYGVPLYDAVQVAAGFYFSLALRANGKVVAWGSNAEDKIDDMPSGLKDVVQIAAGGVHALALRADGTVVGWGSAGPPPALHDVVQIAAGDWHSLALRADGTVVGWGWGGWGQHIVPAGLKDVVQVAAGPFHSLALKADGTVVAWGNDESGQATVPAGLKDVVYVAAGYEHSLALKADGTVVAWGNNGHGQATVPAGLVATVP
jgi:alpha-tubulin suppressor-like RCC1 family protein